MELWIRSQDKLILTRMNEININYKKPTEIICNHYLYGEQHENYTFLGEYATKERALEVLNEIQEAQLGNFHYRCPSNVKVNSKEDTIVYKMPEE